MTIDVFGGRSRKKKPKKFKLTLEQAEKKLRKVSNIRTVRKNARKFFGIRALISVSRDNKHKYVFELPHLGIKRSFGDINYEDYTKHKDKKRRHNYLSRAGNTKGKWTRDKYSRNNLSMKLLW